MKMKNKYDNDNNNKNYKKKHIGTIILTIIISSIFIFPLNIGIVNAETSLKATNYGELNTVQNACGGNALNNVRNSFIMSVVTLCLGGILDKTAEWKQYKCDKVVCKYDSIKNGLDPTFCEKQYAYNTCKFVIGETFALPPMAILEHMRQLIADVSANPVGVLYSAAVKGARAKVAGECGNDATFGTGLICNFANIFGDNGAARWFLYGNDVLAIIGQMKGLFEGGMSFEPSTNSCSRIDDIKKEMEEIIKIREGGY